MSLLTVNARIWSASSDERLTSAEVDQITNATKVNLDEQEYATIAEFSTRYDAASRDTDTRIRQLTQAGHSLEAAVRTVTRGQVTVAEYNEDKAARDKLRNWVNTHSPNSTGGTIGVVGGSAAVGAGAGAAIGVWFFGVGAAPGAVIGGIIGAIGGTTARVID